jgi:hypothetical protein
MFIVYRIEFPVLAVILSQLFRACDRHESYDSQYITSALAREDNRSEINFPYILVITISNICSQFRNYSPRNRIVRLIPAGIPALADKLNTSYSQNSRALLSYM